MASRKSSGPSFSGKFVRSIADSVPNKLQSKILFGPILAYLNGYQKTPNLLSSVELNFLSEFQSFNDSIVMRQAFVGQSDLEI